MPPIAAFLAVCSASNSLVFFEPGACNLNRNHIGCYNAAPGLCCTTSSPWCGSLSCKNCPQGTATWAYSASSCGTPGPSGWCTEPGDLAWCCINLHEEPDCSAIWFTNTGAKRDELAVRVLAVNETEGCIGSIEPNMMHFMDDEGVVHEIHMPKGTFTTVTGHFKDGNWAELQKFPAWGEFLPSTYITNMELT